VYFVAVLGLSNQGCMTLFRGTHEDLSIDSTPSGAVATLSDGQTCNTPCALQISRGNPYSVKFSKNGCDEQTALVRSNASAGALTGAAVLSILTLGIGLMVDISERAVYDADPNPVSPTLQCTSSS
jgi:hypothetical protein